MARLVKTIGNFCKFTYQTQHKAFACLAKCKLNTPVLYQNKNLLLKRPNSEFTRAFSYRQNPRDEENKSQNEISPKLMNFPMVLWPSLIYGIKNIILSKLIIQPYFDTEFKLAEFVAGAKQALVYVSSQLANGNIEALQGLVDNEAVETIKVNYAQFDVQQRQKLAVKKEDIFFSFAYQIGIILEADKRFAEIMTVFHCCEGFEDLKKENLDISDMMNYQDRVTVCNYRFIREFTKGVQSDWQINLLNHIRGSSL